MQTWCHMTYYFPINITSFQAMSLSLRPPFAYLLSIQVARMRWLSGLIDAHSPRQMKGNKSFSWVRLHEGTMGLTPPNFPHHPISAMHLMSVPLRYRVRWVRWRPATRWHRWGCLACNLQAVSDLFFLITPNDVLDWTSDHQQWHWYLFLWYFGSCVIAINKIIEISCAWQWAHYLEYAAYVEHCGKKWQPYFMAENNALWKYSMK